MPTSARDDPFVWKMRKSMEPIPSDKRDLFRAARGILWWTSVSLLFWSLVVLSVVDP